MRISHFTPALAVALLLSACGSSKEDNQVTETRMDNLDSLEGTISDDMINTDESNDEAPVEAAPAGSDSSATAAPKADAASAEAVAGDTAKVEVSSEPK